MSGHASSQHEGAISLVLCAGSSRSPGERRTERVELSTVYRELTAKSPTPHAHFPHAVHLRSCACWFGCCYTRACSMLSPGRSPGRGGSGVRLDGVAACPCAPSAPCSVHAFPSSGPGRGGGRGRRARTPRRRAEAAWRRLADYGARSLVSSVDCRCSCTGPVPANPGRRVHASYLTHDGGAGIELSSVYRYHRLHATGEANVLTRNTRRRFTREPFRNRCT